MGGWGHIGVAQGPRPASHSRIETLWLPPGRMGDPFGRWSSSPSRSEYDDRSPLRRSNSFVRLTGKTIYNQRKDYGQTLLKLQNDFQHHVEHLLTMHLERELRSAEDCLGRLKELEEQGRIWGQDVILEVKDQELVLSDVESKEELEAFPLGSVQGCSAGLGNAVLAVRVQERSPPRSSVLLFQCERLGAETLRSSLEKVLRQRKEEQSDHHGHRYGGPHSHPRHRPAPTPYPHPAPPPTLSSPSPSPSRWPRSSPDSPPSPAPPYAAPERWAESPEPDPYVFPRRGASPQRGLLASDYRESRPGREAPHRASVSPGAGLMLGTPVPPGAPDAPRMARPRAPAQAVSEAERDVEILNHVLGDLELFMGRLQAALSSASTKKKPKKPGRKGGGVPGGLLGALPVPAPGSAPPALPPRDEYTDFFQKVKYALNLLGRSHLYVTDPDPLELLRLIFSALSFALEHSPSPGLAPAVRSPLLLPEALQLLEESLGDEDYGVWKSLGTAWNKSRAEYPESAPVPAYTPVFSDGWLPPVMEQERRGGLQDTPAPASVSPTPLRRPSPSLPPAQAPAPAWRDNPSRESPLPAQGLVRALYDFQARNSQELSVRRGDTLQVLDQQRKWWLVQDERGDRGHVPGNILEPVPEPGRSAWQDSPPTLQPSSSPAEVTAWLMDKGFSRITRVGPFGAGGEPGSPRPARSTVRTLGVLRGHELLQMSPAELRGVCPEEWRRVLFKLSPIRTSLGIGPRD
uniref:epidermal growth factor receptor kinase substrate 8-like protein 3 n=1 Tax=Lonchura striata TaxID=40157 RepID=UPI001293C2BC|nr:epidermal growth factor receptor kinase substrate 8-like protein 3 [Lonchura striata domestica]